MNGTQESLDLLRRALGENNPALLEKAGFVAPSTAITGLQEYYLDDLKNLVAFLSPLRNMIPRVGGGHSIQANWKAITAVNTASIPATVAEGKRGGVVTTTVSEYLAAFRGIGLEDNITEEAQMAAEGFVDVRALAVANLLETTKVEEEHLILAGQGTYALGTTPTPTGTLTSGGAMTAQATVAYCVALTWDGWRRATLSATGVVDTVAVLAAGPYGGTTTINAGHAAISAEAAPITTAGGNLAITWKVTAVPGAFAYAWYTGLTGAANCKLAAITTINVFAQVANATGTNQAANFTNAGTDRSQNALAFDGLIPLCVKSGSNGYYKSYDGAAFTYDTNGGNAQIDAAFVAFYGSAPSGNLRLSPTDIWMSPADIPAFSKNVLAGSIFRASVDMSSQTVQGGGMIVDRYLNKVTGTMVGIHQHPDMPSGKLLFTTSKLPYALNGIPNVFRILTRKEYRAYDWPMTQRAYEYGVYADEVLQCFFPPSLGIIDNFVA